MAINKVQAIEMYSKDSSTLTGGYDEFVSSLDEACFMIRIVNASDTIVNISYDGASLHDVVRANSAETLYFQTNKQPRSNIANMAKGQKIWLNGNAGTGYIYLAGYYSK